MARGHKTGGRQKGTPNKANAQLATELAEAAGRVTASLSPKTTLRLMDVAADDGEFRCRELLGR